MASELNTYSLKVLRDLSTHGFEDFLDVEGENYKLNLTKARDNKALNNIKKLVVDKMGKISIELYDQLDIITLMNRLDKGGSADSDDDDDNEISLDDLVNARKRLKMEENDNGEDE